MPAFAEDVARGTDKVGLSGDGHFTGDGYGLGRRFKISFSAYQSIYQELVRCAGGNIVANYHVAVIIAAASVPGAAGQRSQLALGIEDIECLFRAVVDVEPASHGGTLLGIGAVYNFGGRIASSDTALPDALSLELWVGNRLGARLVVHQHRKQLLVGGEDIHRQTFATNIRAHETFPLIGRSYGNLGGRG